MSTVRWSVGLVLGVAMFVIGLYIAFHPLLHRGPLTGLWWLDMAFAVVFMLRGLINIRTAMARRARG